MSSMSLKRKQEDKNGHASSSDNKVKKIDDPKLAMKLFDLVDKENVKELHDVRHIKFLKIRDAVGNTLLHRAVKLLSQNPKPKLSMLKYLLKRAPQMLAATNKAGQTPMCYACSKCQEPNAIEIITALLDANTDPHVMNIPDKTGLTPLFHLVEYGSMEGCMAYTGLCPCVDCNGEQSDSDFEDNYFGDFSEDDTRLRPKYNEMLNIIKSLIQKGANVNIKNSKNKDLISCIVQKDKSYKHGEFKKSLSKLITEKGLLISPISVKCAHDLKTAKLMVDNMDLKEKDEQGWTPLHHMFINEGAKEKFAKFKEGIIKYMMEKDATIEEGVDIIQLASENHCDIDFIKYLLEKSPGYNVNTKDSSGSTLLIEYGTCSENIEFLLNLGADVKIVNNAGKNVLFSVLKCDGKLKCICEKLITLGADPLAVHIIHRGKKGNTQFDRDTNIMKLLCEKSLEYGFYEYNNEFLPCLKYLLKLQQLQTMPMSQNLVSIYASALKYLCDSYIDNKKQGRIIQLLTLIANSNNNIKTMLIDASLDSIDGIKYSIFKNTKLDCISYLIATVSIDDDFYDEDDDYLDDDAIARKSETAIEQFEEFINTMFEIGFSVTNIPQNSVTALTLVLGSYRNNLVMDPLQLIERGVNVGSTALKFQKIKGNTEEQVQKKQEIKDTYCIPDALLFAYLRGKTEYARLLLEYCWFPPIFFLYFEPMVSEYDTYHFKQWYDKFHDIAIPLGSPLFNISRDLLSHSTYDTERVNEDSLFISCQESMRKIPDSPASLQELAKYATRFHLAKQASLCGSNLPAMIQNTVPERLHFLILH